MNVTYSLYVPEDKLTEGDELTIYNEYELVYGRINGQLYEPSCYPDNILES